MRPSDPTHPAPRPLPRRGRYRVEDGKTCIELFLRRAGQLFDARDPSPFRERDLDDDAVEWLVTSVEERPYREPLKIVVSLAEPPQDGMSAEAIRTAVQAHFEYQAELVRRQRTRLFRLGWFFLGMGLLALLIFLTLASQAWRIRQPTLQGVVKEGLTITGWVALWRPLEIFLFDWWPTTEKLRTYRRILATEISVRFPDGDPRS